MIEQEATVVAVSGEFAEVEAQRRSACGDCSAKAGCGSALLAGLFGKRPSRLRVLNRIQAQPGDQVVIGMREGAFLRAAVAMYTLPLVAMIAGSIGAQWLAARSGATTTELASLLGGLLGLIAGLGWVRRFARRSARDEAYQAVVLRRSGSARLYVPFS
jgi:sigma-E factor negative regulatory protein RseC